MSVRRLLDTDTEAPRAATWQVRDVSAPWVPESWYPHVPWAESHAYSNDHLQQHYADASWHVIGGTTRGRVHANDGTHREDAMAMAASPHLVILIAADGAGSSRWSRVGAETACRTVLDTLSPALTDPDADIGTLLRDAVSRSCRAIEAVAHRTGEPTREFRSTLLAACWLRTPHHERLHAIQVGDGAMVARRTDGSVLRLVNDVQTEYSGEVSAFLPDDNALEAVAVQHAAADVEAILVMTDGVEDPFYPLQRHGARIVDQFYQGVPVGGTMLDRQGTHGPIAGSPQALEHLREWLAFERRGENDDRTILGAFRLDREGR